MPLQMVLKLFIDRLQEILNVSDSFISKWWLVFEADGVIGVATELPRQQGLFECRAANGNQLVAAEELLNLTATAYSRTPASSSNPDRVMSFCCCGHQLEENAKINPKIQAGQKN